MQKLQEIETFSLKRTIAIYSILVLSIGLFGFSTIEVFAQNEEPTPGTSIAAAVGSVAAIIIAITALARDIVKIKAVNDRLTAEQKQRLTDSLDIVESLMTKVTENTTEMQQLTDTIYYQLLPEESKKIVDKIAIKSTVIAEKLTKDTAALNQIREIIASMKLERISESEAEAKIQNILSKITDTPTASKIKSAIK